MIYINGKFLSQKITGVQRFAIELIKEFLKLKVECLILCPKNISLYGIFEEDKILVIGNKTGTLWEQIDLPIYLNTRSKFTLLNLCNTAPIFIRDQVVTIHDVAFLRNPKWFSRAFSTWYGFLIPIIAKRAKKVITVSKFSKSEIIELLNVPEKKIHVVYNSVSSLHSKSDDPSDLGYGKFFLFVGSMDPRKNVSVLIKSFNNANIANVKLILVGRFNNNFGNSQLSINDDIIRLTEVDDVMLSQLYSKAIAFIYPSLYEGFGLPLVEAMSYGCPVISSNSTCLPEVCGDAALYFDPNDSNELMYQMVKICAEEKLRKDLIEKGYNRIQKFSWHTSAMGLKNILTLPEL
ncbi:glycosyltransferase family 1 protein [Pedobacter agri]|uniref:glycosyltransferase family 4 protein n=1 Tax=Pedobacter agri TaxID=454586 RepID=UPI00292D10C2|nr:glycosyltransferase family 1 protein [Pedobacter agri]